MNIGQQILFSISALGALNGFILSVYLFLNKKKRTLSVMLLATLLLTFSFRVGKSVLLYFNSDLPRIFLQIGLSCCFLLGPLLFFYIKSVQEKKTIMPIGWKIHLVLTLAIITIAGILYPFQTYIDLWNFVIVRLIYIQWGIYVIATAYLLRKELVAALTDFRSQEAIVQFQFILWLGFTLIYMAYVFTLLDLVPGIYISGPLTFSLMLSLALSFSLKGNGLAVISPITGAEPKTEKKKIANNDANAWLERLDKWLREEERFKEPNLKLMDLAQAISITPHQLSQLLNDNAGKGFSTYLNEYRIEAACKLIRMNSPLSFEALGYEVGYNSKSTFYTAFKKVTGHTPAEYKDMYVL